MKLVTYNIQYGLGQDDRYDLSRIVDAIAGADIIALQEVDRFWERSGMADQAAELAALLPDFHWVYGAGVDLNADLRDAAGRPVQRRRQFGNMLLSRKPILSSRNHLLPKYGALKGISLQRSALEAVVATASGPIRFYSLHLTHLAAELRATEIRALLAIHQNAPVAGGVIGGAPDKLAEWLGAETPPPLPRAAVLMGDFNLTPNEAEYSLLVGPRSERYGRLGNTDGFVDAWVASGHAEDSGVTCEGFGRLDYCLVSTGLAGFIRNAYIDSEARGSDHQPVWTEIEL